MKKRLLLIIFLSFGISCLLLANIKPENVVESHNTKTKHLALTVYNNNLALVRDVREIDLPRGEVQLKFMDVAETIMAETVSIKNLSPALPFEILEQNYEYDLLSPAKLMEKYVGKELILLEKVEENNTEKEIRHKALLLSTNNGYVFKIGNQILINKPFEGIIFPEIPKNLISHPTLVWLLSCASRGSRTIETTYLAKNISWKADYVLLLNNTDTKADLIGWVTLRNNSGVTYPSANLKLIAGEVHTAQEENRERMYIAKMKAPSVPKFEEKPFFEYHMYTLARKTTIKNKQSKQITLLSGNNIPIKKIYILNTPGMWYQGGDQKIPCDITVKLRFKNNTSSHLGIPLPKGTIRVYKNDASGSKIFIGEDKINHTPTGEKVELTTGKSFDIKGTKVQTSYTKIAKNIYQTGYRIEIKNHKTTPVDVVVNERIPGDWQILSSTLKYKKISAHMVRFVVNIPSHGKASLYYKVQIKW